MPAGDPPAPFAPWLAAVRAENRPSLADLSATPASLLDLARDAARFAEERFHRIGGPGLAAGLDCTRGCADCCRMPVETTVPEAAAAWRYAVRQLPEAAVEGIRERARDAATAYPGYATASEDGPMDLPCPFLADEACLVHPARPLACRGWNSYRVAACREARRGGRRNARIPSSPRMRAVFASPGEALARGLAALGLDPVVHLAPAVAVLAGGDPEARLARWREGEDPFARARPGWGPGAAEPDPAR